MEKKLCKKCGIEKALCEFRMKKDKTGKYYLYSYCKNCEKEYMKDKRKKYDKKYREKNKEIIKQKNKKRYNDYYEKYKDYHKKYMITWKQNNKDKLKKYYKNDYNKRMSNEISHMKEIIRKEVARSFRVKNKKKNNHTIEIIGCDIEFLTNYLISTYEKNYNEKWNWEYLSKVHVDHIIPLKTAKTENDIIRLNHYTNLQLLKVEDNLHKGAKLDYTL